MHQTPRKKYTIFEIKFLLPSVLKIMNAINILNNYNQRTFLLQPPSHMTSEFIFWITAPLTFLLCIIILSMVPTSGTKDIYLHFLDTLAWYCFLVREAMIISTNNRHPPIIDKGSTFDPYIVPKKYHHIFKVKIHKFRINLCYCMVS